MSIFGNLRRNHDFTVLWVGQTISDLGSQASSFVYPLLAYALTGSAVLAALAQAVNLLGMALTVLPAGVLADRMHRGRLMRLASGTGAVLYGSLVAAAMAGDLTVAHLLVVSLLTGVGTGLFAPAEISAVRTIVPEDDLPAALSQNEARSHLAALTGAPLGGALYAVTRWLPFLLDAVSYAFSWVLLGRIRADLGPARPDAQTLAASRRRSRHDVAEGLHFVWRQPVFRAMLLYSPAANLVVNAMFTAAVLRLIEAGTAPWAIGMVDLVAGLSGLAGAAVAPRIVARVATGRLTAVSAWSFVPLMVPMIFWNNPVVVAVALAAGLFLNPAGKAAIGSYRLAITPLRLVGRVQATSRFVSWSTHPLAPILGGALLGLAGGPRAVAVLTVLSAGVAMIPTLHPSIRAVPRPDEWRAELAASRQVAAA